LEIIILKKLLENYLWLLTEDPELDAYEEKIKKAKANLRSSGTGEEGGDRLHAKYSNTPKDKIPPHHKKIMDDYTRKATEFDDLKRERDNYSKWIRDGKVGPKPGSRSSFGGTGYTRPSGYYKRGGFGNGFN
jgi:hypothetical protein